MLTSLRNCCCGLCDPSDIAFVLIRFTATCRPVFASNPVRQTYSTNENDECDWKNSTAQKNNSTSFKMTDELTFNMSQYYAKLG